MWICHVVAYWPSSCQCKPVETDRPTCATSEGQASLNLENYLFDTQEFPGAQFFIGPCHDTGSMYAPNSTRPKYSAQTIPPPSCDGMDGDSPCRACAKTYCCSEFQACLDDMN